MNKIILYGRRNTGMIALLYLKARGYNVVVADDSDWLVRAVASNLGVLVTNTDMELFTKTFDLFICVHGTRIFTPDELVVGKMVNIHPCLWKYKGKDPISRYIQNKDELGSVESHFIVKKVDAGDVICRTEFLTGVVKTHEEFYNTALPFYTTVIGDTLHKLGI